MLRIALGGALGTLVRLGVGGAVVLSASPPGPVRLLVLNTAGAGLLGCVVARRPVPDRWLPAVTTGLLGAMTTFSTLVVQAGTLGHDAGLVEPGSARMTGPGLALVAAHLALSVAAGLVALRLGRRLGHRTTAAPR